MYVLECPQCGAPAPTPPDRVCAYCKHEFAYAPGAHAPDGFGLNWLLDRAREHLGVVAGALVGPAIDARAVHEARRSYARNALADEALVAVYDPGRAMDGVGWALTQRRFCWSTVEGPRDIPWRALTPDAVSHVHPSLTVAGSAVPVADPDAARALAALLRLLAMSAQSLPAPREKAAKFSDEAILQGLQRAVGFVNKLYYWPDIPKDKEQNAREVYGGEIHPAEKVLALYDTTWLGGGDEGWILTARRVYSNSSWGVAWVDLENIVGEGVAVMRDHVSVQMKAAMVFPEELRGRLAAFVRTLAKY